MEDVEHYGLVVNISRKLYKISKSVQALGDLEDVIQIGVIGLLDAKKKFKESKGVKFTSYAQWRIRGQIIDAARDATFIRTPRLAIVRNEGIVPVASLQELYKRGSYSNTFKNYGYEYQNFEVEEKRPGIHSIDLQRNLERFLRSLNKQEKILITLYFGLDGQIPLNLREISELIGIGQSRASQMIKYIFEQARDRKLFDEFVRKDNVKKLPRVSNGNGRKRNIRGLTSVA